MGQMVTLHFLIAYYPPFRRGINSDTICREKRHVSPQEATEAGRKQGSWKLHAVASRRE